jgi:hypothetical protein
LRFRLATRPAQTGRYSHRLLFSLIPSDHRTLLREARIPLQVVIAENDEMFSRAAFEPAIHPFRPDAKIVVVEASTTSVSRLIQRPWQD